MRPQIWLIFSAFCLFAFGLLMVFNTTAAEVLDGSRSMSLHSAVLRQSIYGVVGILLGVFLYVTGYKWLLSNANFLFWGGVFLLVLVLVPGIGQSFNGSRRWLSLFSITFQPSELMKILLPLFFVRSLSLFEPICLKKFLLLLSMSMIPIGLILFEPDNGTAAILLSVLVVLFFICRLPLRYWALPLALITLLGGAIAYQLPYVHKRIEVYLHPELDLLGKGHQPHQAKIAAGSGGLFGRGLGESLQKLNYLPEARSDYIAAIFAEEMGFVGMLGLIALYATLCFAGLFTAIKAENKQKAYLAAIFTYLIGSQACLNLGIVSGLLPSKGTTLPFFSQGGSSLIVNWMVLFLLFDLARRPSCKVEL